MRYITLEERARDEVIYYDINSEGSMVNRQRYTIFHMFFFSIFHWKLFIKENLLSLFLILNIFPVHWRRHYQWSSNLISLLCVFLMITLRKKIVQTSLANCMKNSERTNEKWKCVCNFFHFQHVKVFTKDENFHKNHRLKKLSCYFFLAFNSAKTKKKRLLEKMHFGMHYVIKVDSVLYNFRATE